MIEKGISETRKSAQAAAALGSSERRWKLVQVAPGKAEKGK
jgi:hypothetical protein